MAPMKYTPSNLSLLPNDFCLLLLILWAFFFLVHFPWSYLVDGVIAPSPCFCVLAITLFLLSYLSWSITDSTALLPGILNLGWNFSRKDGQNYPRCKMGIPATPNFFFSPAASSETLTHTFLFFSSDTDLLFPVSATLNDQASPFLPSFVSSGRNLGLSYLSDLFAMEILPSPTSNFFEVSPTHLGILELTPFYWEFFRS